VEERQGACTHETDERAFEGVWVADELRKAVELKYVILDIHVIWQYEMTVYDQNTGEGGHFVEYVNTFLKIKQEASGWPEWCRTDADRDRYLFEYERDEGIRLDREKIARNPGLRQVAKLCLNAFWGKFGQRNNLKQTSVIKDRETLLKLLTSPDKEVFDILIVNEEVLYANWRLREEAVTSAGYTNVVIAAYTTAQARLKLYESLERLGRRVLYYDTDSCIFVCRGEEGEYSPPIGTLLGDWTNELENKGPDAYIETFISGGPKFYCYRGVVPRSDERFECCKIKGISLNYANSQRINFESIRGLIEREFDDDADELGDAITITFRSIRRLPTHEVVTRDETKTCRVVLRKRRFINHRLSLPYGYLDE